MATLATRKLKGHEYFVFRLCCRRWWERKKQLGMSTQPLAMSAQLQVVLQTAKLFLISWETWLAPTGTSKKFNLKHLRESNTWGQRQIRLRVPFGAWEYLTLALPLAFCFVLKQNSLLLPLFVSFLLCWYSPRWQWGEGGRKKEDDGEE